MSKELIQKFVEKLGDGDYVTSSQLSKTGIFGSRGSLNQALKSGKLPHLKIGSNRTLIDRAAVIQYLNTCLSNEQ